LIARRSAAASALALLAASVSLIAPVAPGAALGASKQALLSGTVPLRGMNVVLYAASPGGRRPAVLGSGRSGSSGAFAIRYRRAGRRTVKYLVATRPGGAAEAGFAAPAGSYRLVAALGAGRVPRRATVNERTTVATGFAMAQFIEGSRVAGKDPGLRNAAAMTRNLVSRRRGGLAPVLRRFPNGASTATLRTFDSLANLLAVCRARGGRCARLLQLGGAPGGDASAADTLTAAVTIAQNPWHNVRRLFALSRLAPRLYNPALGRGKRPDAWTLALRFEGDGESMNGPGAFAIDAQGNLWVANNYEFSRERLKSVCAAENLLRFTPTGRYFPGSPYTGGGLSGAGFGIGIDTQSHVWVGNFGFAAPECKRQPPHNSVSEFTISGEPLSPPLVEKPRAHPEIEPVEFEGGWEDGHISWPQSTISDREGNIWIANCGNNSVTKYIGGNHELALNLGEKLIGLRKPFGSAVNAEGRLYVTGNDSDNVAILNPSGAPVAGSPVEGGGLHEPMGIAIDSNGYAWVANSGKIAAPCPVEVDSRPSQGNVVLIKPNGELARRKPIEGAGLQTPWGIAVDGDDHVWVANFSGKRVSELCGTTTALCPPGRQHVGASISPRRSGYGFNGLVRNTGVAIDPSGNVWLTNNWKQLPIQKNPGGYQVVALLGLAAPVKAPLIGPAERP
jgi:DNA-binding beta-propeller fold protein YncE